MSIDDIVKSANRKAVRNIVRFIDAHHYGERSPSSINFEGGRSSQLVVAHIDQYTSDTIKSMFRAMADLSSVKIVPLETKDNNGDINDVTLTIDLRGDTATRLITALLKNKNTLLDTWSKELEKTEVNDNPQAFADIYRTINSLCASNPQKVR